MNYHRAPRHLADIDNRELERVKRQAKQEEEWEQRALAQEREEDTIKTMQHKEKMAAKERRIREDQILDNGIIF